MKIALTYLFLIQLSMSIAQNFESSAPISVASGYGFNHPQIEITNDNKPLVLWTSHVDLGLYVAKHDGSNGFMSPQLLSPVGFDVQNYNWSGADLAIDGDNVYVTFRSAGYSTGHIYTVKSSDNGENFSDTVRVDNLATGYGQYPDIAVYEDTLWVTFMDHDANGLNPQYVVSRSTDGGATFEAEVLAGALIGNEACDCCQPEIIVNNQYLIVYLRNNDNNIRDIKGAISYDRGVTFTSWFSVDDHNWLINACPSTGPDSRFLDDNTSVTVYKSIENGDAKIFMNEYDHSTNTSTSITRIFDAESTNLWVNYPQVATHNGILGVVWEGKGNESGTGTDIFINSSSSGNSGISAINAFNVTNLAGNQTKPDIAITNGAFHLVYADNANTDLKYVQLTSLTGIDYNAEGLNITIYPNPATHQVNIDLSKISYVSGSISVKSISGKTIYSQDLDTKQGEIITIKTENWTKGLYIINLETDHSNQSFKITI
jgi:hypothetical protein